MRHHRVVPHVQIGVVDSVISSRQPVAVTPPRPTNTWAQFVDPSMVSEQTPQIDQLYPRHVVGVAALLDHTVDAVAAQDVLSEGGDVQIGPEASRALVPMCGAKAAWLSCP